MSTRRHPVSADVPDPRIRAFLAERAEHVGVTLPPMGPSPKRWWGPWRAPSGEVGELPSGNDAFVRTYARKAWIPLLLGAILATVNYVVSALVPWSMGNLLDASLDHGITAALIEPSIAFVVLVILMALTSGAQQMTEISLWMTTAMGAVRGVGHRLARNGRAVKKEMPAGDVVTALMTDADYFGGAYAWSPEIVAAIVSTTVLAVLMFRASVPLGLVVMIGLPVVIIAMTFLVKPLQDRQAVAREEQGKLTTISTDAVSGLRVLRGIGGEDVFNESYRAQSARVRDAGIRVASTAALLAMLRTSTPLMFMAIVAGYGATLTFSGYITVGQLVAFFGYTAFLRVPISVATNAIQHYTRAWVGVKKMTKVLAIPELVGDSVIDEGGAPDRGAGGEQGEGSGLDWAEATLEDHSTGVRINPGRLTALVSADPDVSAAIARRLGRVDDAEQVLIDGTDARTIRIDDIREAVFLSEAEAQLFAGTLRDEVQGPAGRPRHSRGVTELVQRELIEASTRKENVLFRPEEHGDDEPWERALNVADAHDVVSSLMGGLDGTISEKGRNLSGGQRQRVALARAVAADAPVLIAIEPTSAVDSHTEARIAGRLAHERRGRTTVIVSASPLVLEHAEEVVLVGADGREIVRGTHDELRRAAAQGDQSALAYRAVVNREVGEGE